MSTIPVSVVIPCYRCAGTIGRAVKSVATQTRRPAEIILVDDASGDDTLPILRELASRHETGWIRVVGLPTNGGPGAARNAGWSDAGQPWIAFLDADDHWHRRKLEVQHAWMVEHPEYVLTGHPIRHATSAEPPEIETRQIFARRVTVCGLLLSNRFQTSSVMLRRDLSQRFDSAKRYCEDYLLWLQIVCAGMPAARINLPLAFQHKEAYGAGGLSGHLWPMEKGELEALYRVRRAGSIGIPAFFLAVTWSLIKYARRLVALTFRRR